MRIPSLLLSVFVLISACDAPEPAGDVVEDDAAVAETPADRPAPEGNSEASGTIYGLPAGMGSGTMVPPEGVETGVTFRFSEVAGRPQVTMDVSGAGTVELSDVEREDGGISFRFSMGERVIACDLAPRSEGGFSGPCTDDAGGAGSMTMVPPTGR